MFSVCVYIDIPGRYIIDNYVKNVYQYALSKHQTTSYNNYCKHHTTICIYCKHHTTIHVCIVNIIQKYNFKS